MPQKIALVDGYSLMYRAFHALPLMDNGEGVYTNAIYGFFSMLLKIIGEEAPDCCAVAFDVNKKTFRHERFAEYKAGRAPTPEEMRPQIPLIQQLLTDMGIAQLSAEGYEADDILGTISRRCEEAGVDALIVTGDRDSYQLAGTRTTILYTKRGITETERVTPEWIMEKYGVTPAQMIDVKALMGDASDNIPGVPGVGEKTAVKLIAAYGTLENTLDLADAEQKGKLRERLLTYRAQAEESKFLATIDCDVPIAFDISGAKIGDLSGALPLMEKLKLKSLIARLESRAAREAPASETQARTLPDLPAWKPVEECKTAEELGSAIARLGEVKRVALYFGRAFTLATDAGDRLITPLGGDLLSPGVDESEIARALAPLHESGTEILTFNIKSLPLPIQTIEGRADDMMLAAYVLNAQDKSYTLEDVCRRANVVYDDAFPAACLFALKRAQYAELARDNLTSLYEDVELKLTYVLRDMEDAGFMVDNDELTRLGIQYKERIRDLTREIALLGSGDVNLNSPKQLGELLFDKLGLPAPASRKGARSTSAEVLEELAEEYPICRKILEYRKYQKLNSTYIEALIRLKDANGRIHTSFEQTATGTGRISSRDPNLQNIPVRTELGREIRRAFIAQPGWKLVDADYSQIELRVLAHMSGDAVMIDAFRKGQDIHARTAAEVFGVPLEMVTHEMRSAAKAVNFGIVYGISDFGLSRNIDVSRKEAAQFIQRYLKRYPDVKRFMDSQVTLGKTQGYVTTMLGRRRYLPELANASHNIRAFGERAAMNSPIQGTAADIIKCAMVRVHALLKENGLRARLILQVHDELIIEAPQNEVSRVAELLRGGMEDIVKLDVCLKTELSTGDNWNECK